MTDAEWQARVDRLELELAKTKRHLANVQQDLDNDEQRLRNHMDTFLAPLCVLINATNRLVREHGDADLQLRHAQLHQEYRATYARDPASQN